MNQDSETGQRAPPSRWMLIGSAALSALFTYTAFLSLALPLVDQWYERGTLNYPVLPVLISVVIVTGVGLRWIVKRHNSPILQASALVGAGIMMVVNFAYAWVEFADALNREGAFSLTLPVGMIIILVVVRLTTNPSADPEKGSGLVLLWRSIPIVGRRPIEEVSRQSKSKYTPSTEGGIHGTEKTSGWHKRIPVSRYWLVIGSAFAVTIPIAVIDTELGIGLLSAFLTAYLISHQIKRESNSVEDEEA